MSPNQKKSGRRALVTVFDDPKALQRVMAALSEANLNLDKVELVTNDVRSQAPELSTPKVHETTATDVVDGALKWGSVGTGAGLLVGGLTAFPGLALGMALMGGATGAFMGALAGVEHAVDDEAVDLPTLEEYQQLVSDGDSLLVMLGQHDDVRQAEELIQSMMDVRSHLHHVHGHEFHEHPADE